MPLTEAWVASVAFSFLAGTAATIVLARAAGALNLLDHPGGRKAHARSVPLVGGLAIFVALLCTATYAGIATSAGYFLFALSIVIAVGMWDDVTEISPRVKFAIEIVASCFMIWGAGIELASVGDLLGWRPIGLWIFAIPLTIFAVVGVVNSLNMMDGLGDAGSLMIGFALGWFAIDLTQGPGRTTPPIAALWVLLLPLADCVSLMTRRIIAGRSPFVADSHHIHHYLLARGFTHGQTLAILVGLSALFGAVGFFGWRLGLPEAALFWPFFSCYFAYHFWIQRAWKTIDAARTASVVLEKPVIAS